jgi:hypothetical protein
MNYFIEVKMMHVLMQSQAVVGVVGTQSHLNKMTKSGNNRVLQVSTSTSTSLIVCLKLLEDKNKRFSSFLFCFSLLFSSKKRPAKIRLPLPLASLPSKEETQVVNDESKDSRQNHRKHESPPFNPQGPLKSPRILDLVVPKKDKESRRARHVCQKQPF